MYLLYKAPPKKKTLKKGIISRRRDDLVPAIGDTGLPRGLCPRHGGRVPGIRHIHRYERRRPVLHAGQQLQPTSVLMIVPPI
jgi:hypothetical protein